MPKLLVTGAAGFIGANFVHYWLRHYPRDSVVGLDALTYAGNRASLEALEHAANFRFVHADIADFEHNADLLREQAIDTIVHFAAESHVDRSIKGPGAFIDTNVTGTHRLLEAARAVWLDGDGQGRRHRFHHVSTDEVFGDLGPDDPAFSETTAYAPSSPYSASKAASDHLVAAYHRTYGLQTTTSNCSNNYGPYQFPEKLVALVITHILDGQPLPVYGDGSNVRDWLYVEDHCRGIDAVLTQGRVGRSYNIGGREEHSNLALVHRLCALMDRQFVLDAALPRRFPAAPPASGNSSSDLIRFVGDRPGHDRRYAIDSSRIEGELHFKPSETFASGLDQTIRWYLDNEPWWRAVMSGDYRDWIADNYHRRAATA